MCTFDVFRDGYATSTLGSSSSASNNTQSRLPSRLFFHFVWLWWYLKDTFTLCFCELSQKNFQRNTGVVYHLSIWMHSVVFIKTFFNFFVKYLALNLFSWSLTFSLLLETTQISDCVNCGTCHHKKVQLKWVFGTWMHLQNRLSL